MLCRFISIAFAALIALWCSVHIPTLTRGAELRSTCGERLIVREVSTVAFPSSEIVVGEVAGQPVIEPYTPFLAENAADSGTRQPFGVGAYDPRGLRRSDGLWVDAEFLLWRRKGRRFPPLVTTQPNAGVLPGARILFGNEQLDEHARPGGRLEFGLWVDPSQNLGMGGHFVALGDAPVRYSIDSSALGFIARPFRDASVFPPFEASFPIANDTAIPATRGQLDLRTGSEVLAGDAFFRWLLARDGGTRVDLLAGYQFGRINEDLIIDSFTQTVPVPPGLPSIAVTDFFRTTNEYHGGHFGLLGEYRFGRWSLELLAKFAFGTMRETVFIRGSTVVVDAAGGVDARAGGLLAHPTNGGQHVQDEFAFMEDIGIKLAYYPVERLKLSLGYSLMYWSSVVRPGEHIDLDVDGRLLDGNPANDAAATSPVFSFDATGFYVHGVNLGAEYRF